MKTFFFIALLIVSVFYMSCKDSTDLNPNTAPVAKFSYSPSLIDTTTLVIFNASASTDVEDLTDNLKFSWDFECQMNWTEPSSNPERLFKFTNPGSYEVGLKVIDSEGWSGEIKKTVIVVDSI